MGSIFMRYNLKLGIIEINWLILPLFVASIYLGFWYILAIAYLSVVIHELFHIITARLLKIRLKKLQILPFGISATLDCEYIKDPKNEILVAISGPVANLLIILVFYLYEINFYWVFSIDYQLLKFIYIINMAIFLVNLLPVLPLDGGRILKAYLTIKWGFIRAFNFTIILTKIFGYALIIIGIWILVITRFNFSLILISAFILSNIS